MEDIVAFLFEKEIIQKITTEIENLNLSTMDKTILCIVFLIVIPAKIINEITKIYRNSR